MSIDDLEQLQNISLAIIGYAQHLNGDELSPQRKASERLALENALAHWPAGVTNSFVGLQHKLTKLRVSLCDDEEKMLDLAESLCGALEITCFDYIESRPDITIPIDVITGYAQDALSHLSLQIRTDCRKIQVRKVNTGRDAQEQAAPQEYEKLAQFLDDARSRILNGEDPAASIYNELKKAFMDMATAFVVAAAEQGGATVDQFLFKLDEQREQAEYGLMCLRQGYEAGYNAQHGGIQESNVDADYENKVNELLASSTSDAMSLLAEICMRKKSRNRGEPKKVIGEIKDSFEANIPQPLGGKARSAYRIGSGVGIKATQLREWVAMMNSTDLLAPFEELLEDDRELERKLLDWLS